MFDEIGDGQICVYGSRVNDPVDIAILKENLTCGDGMLLAARVIEIDTAGSNGADENAGVSVPAAIAAWCKHEMLDVEIGRPVRMQFGLPRLNAPIRISRDFNLLSNVA